MAIQFNTNNTGVFYSATTALDAFRLGLMVNPTTGANVSRAVADQRTDVEAVFGFTTEAEQESKYPYHLYRAFTRCRFICYH